MNFINYQSASEESNEALNKYLATTNGYIPIGVDMINAPYMWMNGYTGHGVKIAVIDTGCADHQDLRENIIGGKNFTNEDGCNPDIFTDYNGHGTHVCGTICANGNIRGIAPNAKILVLKVLDGKGNGTITSLINAINYAVEQKVDIISMSLGFPTDLVELRYAVNKALDKGIVIICACGNSGDGKGETDEITYPAYYNRVISVGAIDNIRLGANFTNSNKEVDLVAPGVDIVSTYLNNGYATLSGTSMATPHVTGAIALLKQWSTIEFGRNLSETELYAQLIKNTIKLNLNRRIQGNGMLYIGRL